MEECDDFVVIDTEPIKSTDQAIEKLSVLIDTFNKSIDAVNQSNILLKDELKQALEVTLQNIKPEPASDLNELFNAFDSELTNSDDIRQNYNKHLLAKLVSINLQNQELEREIEAQRNVNESRNTMISLKLQQAMSSLNVIQSFFGVVGYTSSHDGDVAPRLGDLETAGHPTCVDQSGGDTKQNGEPVHDENGSPSDEEISATLTDLCNRLCAVQKCIAQTVPHGTNTTVRSSGQTHPEECVETSSFFTVDDQLSCQHCSGISSSSATPNPAPVSGDKVKLTQPVEVAVPLSRLEAPRSSQGGGASSWGQEAVSQTTLKDVSSQCEKPAPVAMPVVSSGQTNTTGSVTLEAACQWMDAPPTRLIVGNQPVIPQESTSNAMPEDSTVEAPGNSTVTPQRWSSNACYSQQLMLPSAFVPIGAMVRRAVKAVGDRVGENHSPKPSPRVEPRNLTPSFSADEETPWCPCCQNQFASRQDLEQHLSNLEREQFLVHR